MTIQKNGLNKKGFSGQSIFCILSEKVDFFSEMGVKFPRISIFYALPSIIYELIMI